MRILWAIIFAIFAWPANADVISDAATFVYTGGKALYFLNAPGKAYLQGYFYIPSGFPNTAHLLLNLEYLDSVTGALYQNGGKFQALARVYPSGTLTVATNAKPPPIAMAGTPVYQSVVLSAPLQTQQWYLLRIQVDFSTGKWINFMISGPGIMQTVDLSSYYIAFPGSFNADRRAVSYRAGAGWLASDTGGASGTYSAYVDDVSGGIYNPGSCDLPLFGDGFEVQTTVPAQPTLTNPMVMTNYTQGNWYLGNPNSVFAIEADSFAHSGLDVGKATVTLSGSSQATAALSASPTGLNVGSSTTLSWSSANAASCTGTNFSTSNATCGNISVSPSVTTTYSVNCGGAVASATVYVDTRVRDSFGWATCTNSGVFTPLSDTAAAAFVMNVQADSATRAAANATPNRYVPTAADLAPLTTEKDVNNNTCVQANPYCANVTGNFVCANTDECIQFAAAKWGIPPDWLRAEYVQESNWYQWLPSSTSSPLTCSSCSGQSCGDLTTVGASSNYPALSRITGTSVCQSLGIAQVRWDHPDGNVTIIGSEPARWKSTAFNADMQAARVRFFFDDPNGLRTAWGDGSYVRCQNWNSIGAWFSPYPWGNSGQAGYVTSVQGILSNRTWAQPGF